MKNKVAQNIPNATVNPNAIVTPNLVALGTTHVTAYAYFQVNLPYLADATGDDSAASPPRGAVRGALAKTTLREGFPDSTGISPACESRVGIQDGVTRLNEVGVAGLSF